MNTIDQVNRTLTGRRIQVRQWLIKQQDIYIIDNDARHRNALLLASRKRIRRMIQQIRDIHRLCDTIHTLKHLILRNTIVFHRKSDILCHRKSDKLTIRILQDGSD